MYLNKLQIKNLRCFSDKELEFNQKITLIEGNNGSGKTTIIEALYYLCYLRSFRTNITQDLIRFNHDSFFIKAYLNQETLQVGFSPAKRLVKLNDKIVGSFKELTNNYRVVVLTEDDLNLIQGGPEARRNFIDQYIYLQDAAWFLQIRNYKKILDQRNALLKNHKFDLDSYQVWTKQLIENSKIIAEKRILALQELEVEINHQLNLAFDAGLKVEFVYQTKIWQENLLFKEQAMQRTLFGSHLEDYQINLMAKSSRKFASRGQQKLVAFLMKMVQIIILKRSFNGNILFLLDDFVTDLDDQKVTILIQLLVNLDVQIIFTAPNLPLGHKNLLLLHQTQLILV